MYESLGQRFDGFVLYLGRILTSKVSGSTPGNILNRTHTISIKISQKLIISRLTEQQQKKN